MRKRFLLTIAVAVLPLIILMCFIGAPTQAQNSGDGTAANISQTVNCGLWTGSDFDVSPPPSTCKSSTSPSAPQPKPSYVALGDSVAAGLGLPLLASGSSTNSACGRSSQAYSYLVANTLDLSVSNYACSGATAGDLTTKQKVNESSMPAQLDDTFAHGTPQYISITAGANDAHWSTFIQKCYVTNCATSIDTATANALLVTLQAKLYYALLNIQTRANGNPPTTVLTGYYQAISQQCAQMESQITPTEVTWIQAETNALNQTIQQVSQRFSFARYAPINFSGHDICSSDPWVQGLNDAAPLHPTDQGQAAIAQAVEAAFSPTP